MQAQKILFATDYSDWSQAALDVASTLASSGDGELLIAHVSESELHPVGERFDEPPRPHPEELARLQQVVPTIEGLRHSHLLLHGVPGAQTTQPAEAILHAAEKENVALIVLGTRGRTGLSRALMGSVAESVLRQAPCGVVVVKPASQD